MWAALKALHARFEEAPAVQRYGAVLCLTAVVSWFDIVTPPYILLTGFYFLPIVLAAWYCGPGLTALTVAVSVVMNTYMANELVPAAAPWWQRAFAYSSVAIALSAFGALVFQLHIVFGRLQEESRTDALTGLRSRRAFCEASAFELTRAARTGHALTLALVDLDNFKQVNDTRGHQTGDALLVAMSRSLTSVLREVDLVGRIGGDEFAILLPGVDVAQAKETLDRVQTQLRPLLQSFSFRVTASIGAVTVTAGTLCPVADLLAKADAMMYSVKQSSKDGVVVVAFR